MEGQEFVLLTPVEVGKMLAACRDWQECLCLTVLAYTGMRRDAASCLQWRDVDLVKGTMRFRKKRTRGAVKPIPKELLEVLRAAFESAAVSCDPDDYVIPYRTSERGSEPAEKIVWETVLRVAKRAGVNLTTHAPQEAFAATSQVREQD